jgi:uncharacterized membrane protein
MESFHGFMSQELNSETENDIVNFVKFKLEPFFEYSLYILAMIIIIFGAIDSIVVGWQTRKGKTMDETLAYMRIRLSETITLGLTFILAAEVIKTFRVPNMYQLLKVALLVLLRQLITHFLDKDVSRLKKEYPGLIESSYKKEYSLNDSKPEPEELILEQYTFSEDVSSARADQETCVSCQ